LALARAHRAPPGPEGSLLTGVFRRARRDPLGFFLDCARRYGDIVSMRLGVHRAYLLSHPDHIKRVLQDNAHAYAKGPTGARVHALFGESLSLMDGDRWRLRRRQVQTAFQPHPPMPFATVVARASAEMLDRWQLLCRRGEPVEVVSEMRRLTQTIIIRAIFGELPAGQLRAVSDALDLAVDRVNRRLWSPLGWFEGLTLVAGRRRDTLDVVNALADQMVSAGRRTGIGSGTLLAALPHTLSDTELLHEIRGLLVAGYTTTASALTWTWCALSEYPEVQGRIEQECRDVLGGRAPGADDLQRLSYTRRVIEEVLRLYPPTWLTARSPTVDDELGGYHVPAGTLILLSPYVTHRHPDVWAAPESFDPDRFGPGRSASRPAFAYIPFGAGPRRCIGSAFATAEMQSIVVAVAQQYRLTLLPGARVDPEPGLTLCPRSPLLMSLRPASGVV
jgi:cytochrome P450